MISLDRTSTMIAGLAAATVFLFGWSPASVEASNRPDWLDQSEYVGGGTVTVMVFLEDETLPGEIRNVAAPTTNKAISTPTRLWAAARGWAAVASACQPALNVSIPLIPFTGSTR